MALPDALLLRRFRCFAAEATLPLRPITLVYGANNSGKSALLRALALLGAALEPSAGGRVFVPDRVYRGRKVWDMVSRPEGGPGWECGLRWEAGPLTELRYELGRVSSEREAIRQLWVQLREGGQELWADGRADGELRLPGVQAPLGFDGLIPREGVLPEAARQHLLELRSRIGWLSGVRADIPDLVRAPEVEDHLRFGDGRGAGALLASDSELLEEVGRYFLDLERPRRLGAIPVRPLGHWLALDPKGASLRLSVQDAGLGMAQVLPVLVDAVRATRQGAILAVEEPESHLHPTAQTTLARFLGQLTARPTRPRFVLETHSRVFLLAFQRQVAEGKLRCEDVAVVWVDQAESGRSRTTVVGMRPDGRLEEGWPPHALGEDLRLARELARRGRSAVEEG